MTTILTIDDNLDNLVVVKALLKNLLPDIEVVTAQSGQEGLEMARRALPDTILLDIHMPDMDGYAVCRALKSDEATRRIPVIMLTAIHTDSKNRIKALGLGADAFLSKPIDEAELVAQIQVMLRIKQAEDALRRENERLDMLVRERTRSLQEELTERQKAEQALRENEEQLRKSLQEKSALLQEVYHRTKNNMAVICAMLSIQAGHFTDPIILKLLDEMSNRIRSMALVHGQLYQTQDLSYIDLNSYTQELVQTLFDNYADSADRIELVLDVESIRVSIETAIPYGQILNELLMNTLNYAFPDGRSGAVRIGLHRVPDSHDLLLEFQDSGIGLPEMIDVRQADSFGFQLLTLLAETQLHGQIAVQVDGGTRFAIRFRELYYPARV